MLLNKCRRKVIALLILVIFLISTVMLPFSKTVYADSNNRITTFINLAAGKQTTDLNMGSLALSQEDLRFLGVYISNFFVPFGTELGNSGESNEDVTAINKEDIKKALQSSINFSDALADSLTETILGLSRSNIKELYLCVSENYQEGLKPVSDSKASIPLNSYTALCCMLGGLGEVISWYEEPNDVMEGVIDGTYKYGYFAYQSGSGHVPVFDFKIDLNEGLTPSSAAFIKCLESVDIEMGYGFNFFDFTEEEMGKSETNYKEKLEKFSADIIYRMSAYGTKLAVDCFGNIIFMGGNHQYVAVPGCMNPYSWVLVDRNGDDIGKGLGGTVYNMVNIPSMALYDNEVKESSDNRLFTSVGESTEENKSHMEKEGVLETKIITRKLKNVVWNYENGEYALRKVRGSNDSSLGSAIGVLFGGSAFRDLAAKAEKGFREAFKKAQNFYGGEYSILDSLDGENEGINTNILGATETLNVYGIALSEDVTQLPVTRSVRVIDSFVYIDNLGNYHFDTGNQPADFSTCNVEHYINESEGIKKLRETFSKWGNSDNNGFTNTYKNIESGKMVIPSEVSKEGLVGIYLTYAYASLYDASSQESKESTIGDLGYRLNIESLPTIAEEPITLSDTAKSDVMETSIRDWIYYLLHPTEGFDYFRTWITNKLNSFFLGWHADMVGTNGTGSINGTTKYRGFSGYVTTPELTDIPWTNSLLNMYNNFIPFLIILMVVIMLGTYVLGVLSLQKSIIGVIVFSLCVALPPVVINSAVGTANRFSSSLYGEKFTYWALVQHESYSTAIDEAASGESYSNYLKTLYETNSKATGNQGNESIMLKWQAPKKMASLMFTNNDERALSGLSRELLSGVLNRVYSGESYLDDKDSVYLYRSYIDIANFSRYIHRGLVDNGNQKQPISQNITNETMRSWSDSLQEAVRNFGTSYEADRSAGYTNMNGNGSSSGLSDKIIRVRLPLNSKLVNEQLEKRGTVKDMSINDYVGINQDAFNFSIPMFNVGSDSMVFTEELETDNFSTRDYTNKDFSSLAAYGLMSENPFYYFSWYLYETGLAEETNAVSGYKNLLLGDDNAGFFYNTIGNGELKDFMDIKSLFTYIIPYLNECNKLVEEWDDTYGIFVYEGVPIEEGHQNDSGIKDNPEVKQKYWHNVNVARLYNMYSPWVDVMYDCSYAEPEEISYLGEKYVIADPINPASYPDGRPMIFSRTEMVDYGLSEKDLTKVEKLILECQEGMQERMFGLLNYHTFNDVVLNTAAAINCAFEFNSTFSENSLFGANHNIYPQAFELNDFSYDAFLRFILSNSTGDSMVVGKGGDFYTEITHSSSMTTVIVMLVLDVIAMYVIPGFKMFFIVGIFVLAVLLILVTAFRVDYHQKFITKFIESFIKPVIGFLLVTCGMSLVVSWFMGEGNTSITGAMETSIALGDPVMAMLLMIVLNCFVVYLYFRILYGVYKDIKKNGKLVAGFMGGMVGSLGAVAAGIVSSRRGSTQSGSGDSSDSENSGSGTNTSTRAKSRGSSKNISEKEVKKSKDSEGTESGSKRNRGVFAKNINSKDKSKSSDSIENKVNKGLSNMGSKDNRPVTTEWRVDYYNGKPSSRFRYVDGYAQEDVYSQSKKEWVERSRSSASEGKEPMTVDGLKNINDDYIKAGKKDRVLKIKE